MQAAVPATARSRSHFADSASGAAIGLAASRAIATLRIHATHAHAIAGANNRTNIMV
jgi:hypothetical protein